MKNPSKTDTIRNIIRFSKKSLSHFHINMIQKGKIKSVIFQTRKLKKENDAHPGVRYGYKPEKQRNDS